MQQLPILDKLVLQVGSQHKLKDQTERFGAKEIDHLFVKWQIQTQTRRVRIIDSRRLISLRNYLQNENRNRQWKQILMILMTITNNIYQVSYAKIPFYTVNIDTIFIESCNFKQILIGIPQFRALLPNNFTIRQINRIPIILSQLAKVFIEVITGNVEIEDLNVAINGVRDDGMKMIIRWMLSIPRQREQPDLDQCLQQLYQFLDDMNNDRLRQKKQFYPLFSVDLFDPFSKPKFYIDQHQYDTYIYQDAQFTVNYQSDDQKLMIVLQHIKSQKTYLIQLHQRHLPDLFKDKDIFLSTRQLWKQIIYDYDKRIQVTSAGFFTLKTQINWNRYLRIRKIYKAVNKIQHTMLGFNQSRLFGYLYSAYSKKEQPIAPRLLEFLQNQIVFMQQFGIDLFIQHRFIEAAAVIRQLIQRQLKDNHQLSDQLYGKGNDEDMLNEMANIKENHQDSVMRAKRITYWDQLFICQYMDIDLKKSYSWYSFILNKHPQNKAAIYGMLNFYYQNDYFDIPNKDMLKLCKKLEAKFPSQMPISVKMLLANIYCFRLGKSKRLKAQQLLQSLPRQAISQTAKIIKYMIQNQFKKKQSYIQLQEYPIYYTYIQGILLLQMGEAKHAKSAFRQCIRINKYFRPAYYGLMDIETNKFHRGQICYDNWYKKTQQLEQQFANIHPKDALISWKRYCIINENRSNEDTIYKQFLKFANKNYTFQHAINRLKQLKIEQRQQLPQSYIINFKVVQMIKQYNDIWKGRQNL